MHELWLQLIFYVFAGLATLSGLMVISLNNSVRCALFLVVAFFASTILWILVQAEFLALILILVYVGAVMTLFLFVVMMLNLEAEKMRAHFWRYLPFGLILVAFLVGLLMIALPTDKFHGSVEMSVQATRTVGENFGPAEGISQKKVLSNTERLGMVLYTDYVLAFELAAAILLVAIIAAITLVHRGNRARSKQQQVLRQLMTRPEDRIELINMKSDNNA